jgi:hypothetical protein
MKSALLSILAGTMLLSLLAMGGCQHDQPEARRPLSPFAAGKAVSEQALAQGVEYPYTAHLASLKNEPALRVLMRLQGLDETAARQHGAVLIGLVYAWGDVPFTKVLMGEDEAVQQYVTTLIRDELWRDYRAGAAEPYAGHTPEQDTNVTLAETSERPEQVDVVCTVDIGGTHGDADLLGMREQSDQPRSATSNACKPADNNHRCPNGSCRMQHFFPCLHRLAMVRYGQYTAPRVAGMDLP